MAQNTDLLELLGQRNPNHQLNSVQRGAVIAIYDETGSATATGRILHLNEGTVRSIVNRATKNGDIDVKKRSGRPRKTSERDDRMLLRAARSNRRQTLSELNADILNNAVSNRTIKRRLHDAGFKKWRAKKRPALTADHARKRLKWARAHVDWDVDKWRTILWSDECWIERCNRTNTWIFRAPTEKWHKDCIDEVPNGPEKAKVMIWGIFAGKMRGPIHIIEGNIDAPYYRDSILDEYLPLFYEEVLDNLGTSPEFMHDNASVHTAQIVRDWLVASNITVMNWPARSPDLNPIEHVWKVLKDHLHRTHPELKAITSVAAAVELIKSVIEEVWQSLENNYFESLVSSMKRRCQAVINANGWYTKY
jgi:transposase